MYSNLAEILLNSVPVLPSSASLAESSGFLQDSCRTPASPAGIGGGLESTGHLRLGIWAQGVETTDKWGVLQVCELQLLSLPHTMHHHANSSPHLSILHPLMSLYHCKLPVPCIANSWSLINIQQLEQMTWFRVAWVSVCLLGLPWDKILTALSRGLSFAFEHI